MRSPSFCKTRLLGSILSPLSWLLIGFCLLNLMACDRRSGVSDATQPPANDSTGISSGAPPPPPDSAFLALLTPDQTTQIRSLGLPLVLPTDIPEGFEVAQLQIQQDGRFPGYQLLYRDGGIPAGAPAANRCFLVEFTVGGIGGTPPTANRQPLNPPILADDGAEYGLNYAPYTDAAQREQFPEPSLISDWLPVEGGFVRLAGTELINNTLTPEVVCTDIAVEEAVAIIDSLAVISDEIQGDGLPVE